MMCITETQFYNKKLCDGVRDVVLRSMTTMEDAVKLLEHSESIEFHSFIIIHLKNRGWSTTLVQKLLTSI